MKPKILTRRGGMKSMSVVKKCVDGYDKQRSYFGNH